MLNVSELDFLQRMPNEVYVLIVAVLVIYYGVRLYEQRSYFRKLKAEGLSMPPHSWLLGHIPILTNAIKSIPSDANAFYLSTIIKNQYPELGPDFYLDLWPFAPSMLVIGSPETLTQQSSKYVLHKNNLLKNFVYPLTKGYDIASNDGPFWKKWRTIFNPGFSANNVMEYTANIVQECQVFCENLDEHASKGDIFPLKPLLDNLIMDVIGKATLDVNLNCQQGFNQFIHSLRTQIKWMTTGSDFNLLNRWNPARPWLQWYHGRIVDKYVGRELDRRIQFWLSQVPKAGADNRRTITDLALSAHSESSADNDLLDPEFRKICMAQLKLFLFAGHDTTSTGTSFNIWVLSQYPKVLQRVREEHDQIFGPDPAKAAEQLVNDPHMINQLPYTLAVIKEALRLFPPVTSSRAGRESAILTDAEGHNYPTKNMVVWANQHSAHRDPRFWVQPDDFLPERWMITDPEDPLYPVKNMWRPFESGPRNCLGRELAMLEMKICVVMVARKYNFKPAYEELDAKKGKKLKDLELLGTRAYQIDSFVPRDRLPVRVERVKA